MRATVQNMAAYNHPWAFWKRNLVFQYQHLDIYLLLSWLFEGENSIVCIGHGNRYHATSSNRDAWNALFSNLSRSGLDNYEVKRFKRPLLEEVA